MIPELIRNPYKRKLLNYIDYSKGSSICKLYSDKLSIYSKSTRTLKHFRKWFAICGNNDLKEFANTKFNTTETNILRLFINNGNVPLRTRNIYELINSNGEATKKALIHLTNKGYLLNNNNHFNLSLHPISKFLLSCDIFMIEFILDNKRITCQDFLKKLLTSLHINLIE